jgi:antitoxin (DNA-binding transcriptional repressor) of toxin-antitoxin stability system
MSTRIDVRELPARWAEAFSLIAAGDEVIVIEDGMPRARLLPYEEPLPRRAGLHAGAIQAPLDFDAPLPDEFWTGRT